MFRKTFYTALALISLIGTLAIGIVSAKDGISYNPDAGITYTDTNGKVFTGIGTITITSGDKSITILDRNLGATTTDINSTGSYGYHFQWGNNYGFTRIQDKSSEFRGNEELVNGYEEGYINTLGKAWNNPYVSSKFIIDPRNRDLGGWNNNGGWDYPYNHNLWGGADDYNNGWGNTLSDYKRQGPCPAGYHVPSQKELDDLLIMYYNYNSCDGKLVEIDSGHHYVEGNLFLSYFSGAFNIPKAGWRTNYDGMTFYLGHESKLWSSSANSNKEPVSESFYVDRGYKHVGSDIYNNECYGRACAMSIRCFLDHPLDDSGTQALILEYETNGGSAIQSQTIPEGEKAYLPGYTTKKEGPRFFGWFNEDGTIQYELSDENEFAFKDLILGSGMATEGIVKIYAKWGYNVTFVDWNGDSLKVESVEEGKSATAPKAPTRDGYRFIGWDKDFSNITEDITVTAQYEVKEDSPSEGSSGGGGGRSSNNKNKGSIEQDNSMGIDENKNNNTQGNENSSNVTEGQNYPEEFQQAYEFAYKNGITTMDSIDKADMELTLTRIAMAKMLSQYAINVLGKKPENIIVPKFDDITKELNNDYGGAVTQAYQLGIMGINMPNNKFRPYDLVPRAEFATALSRLLYQTVDGEPYYKTHLDKLKKEGIITNDDYKMKELRGYVMIMLNRSQK